MRRDRTARPGLNTGVAAAVIMLGYRSTSQTADDNELGDVGAMAATSMLTSDSAASRSTGHGLIDAEPH